MNDHDLDSRTEQNTNVIPGDQPIAEDDRDKKKKKRLKKEEKRRRDLLERFPSGPAELDGLSADEAHPAALEATSTRQMKEWMRPAFRSLATNQLTATVAACALVAINGIMLSVAALAVYRGLDEQLAWGFIPLALTNLLSLVFAVFSAQSAHRSTLEDLSSVPEEEFEGALRQLVQDKKHLYGALEHDLRLAGADLLRRKKHLRTAFNVLLGGIPLSMFTFVVFVAVSARG